MPRVRLIQATLVQWSSGKRTMLTYAAGDTFRICKVTTGS